MPVLLLRKIRPIALICYACYANLRNRKLTYTHKGYIMVLGIPIGGMWHLKEISRKEVVDNEDYRIGRIASNEKGKYSA